MRRTWYRVCGVLVVAAAVCACWSGGAALAAEPSPDASLALSMDGVKAYVVPYVAWNGEERESIVLLPADYRPGGREKLPCIINPHPRGSSPWQTAKLWGELPTTKRFAVICAGSAGRVDEDCSWSYVGQVADLMDLPDVVTDSLPWLRFDSSRLYAVGVSMGGTEALSMLARYPDRLAAAASFDGVVDLAAYYRSLPWTVRKRQQRLLRREVGGSPAAAPFRYTARSPVSFTTTLASCGVPIGVWWSYRDHSVRFQELRQSGKLCARIRWVNDGAPLYEVATDWPHGFALRDDPERVLEFLCPDGRWLAKAGGAPDEWSYSSWLPDVSVWGYRFVTRSGLSGLWRVTVTADRISVRTPAPLTVQVPWGDTRTVTVVINDQPTEVQPEGGVLSVRFPAGSSAAVIDR